MTAALVGTGLLLASCGGGSTGAGGGGTGGTTPGDTTQYIKVDTGKFVVPPGDSFECFYTSNVIEADTYVSNAKGQQGPGGHHITVYYTDTPQPPGHHTCDDAEMVSWHQIAGADTNKEPVIFIPEGAAATIPKGKQIVVQSHYINTTGAPQTVDDVVEVQIVDKKDVKYFINFWAMVDLGFSIPPVSAAKSVTTCTLTEDVNTVLMVGHMHELGKHFKLETIDDAGNPLETLYEQDWQPLYVSHPPARVDTLEKPLALKKGTRFRQTCEWNNDTPDPVLFPREMCVTFAFYYPDKGFLECDGTPESTSP
jgi:hypothetical protein